MSKHFLRYRLHIFLLFTIFIVIGCASTQNNVNQKTSENKIIIFADLPFVTIDTGMDKTSFSFYNWIYEAFRSYSPKGFTVVDDVVILRSALNRGINPIVEYIRYKGRICKEIAYLSFDEANIEQLYDLAEELGAVYLIKAKLVSNEKRIEETPPESKTIPLFGLYGLGTTTKGKKESVFVIRVEFTVYDVINRDILLTKELETITKEITGKDKKPPWEILSDIREGGLLGDIRTRKRLVTALFDAISSHATESKTDTDMVLVNKRIRIEIPNSENTSWEVRTVILEKVKLIDNNLLQFQLSTRNFYDDKLKIKLQRSNDKTLDSYIIDNNGIRYQAVSSSLTEDSVDIRPGERKDFFLVFPIPATLVKQVDFYSKWDIDTPQKTHAVIIKFKDVPIP